MAASRRANGLGARAFVALLALYPAAFRDQYGRELALVFIDRYRDAAGRWARLRLWLEALAGILNDAPKEHLHMILQDLGYAWRVLRQHSLVSITIVLTLGLGIGANTAVFSVLNTVALRAPLRVADPDQLYSVNGGEYITAGQESARFSGPMLEQLRQAAPPGTSMAAMSRGIARVYTRAAGEPDTTRASLQLVSADFFPVLGVAPVLGRAWPVDRSAAADEPVAVLSHACWLRRFGASPDIIGRPLVINGVTFTIVGVGPPEFAGVWLETPVDIWVPLTQQSALRYSQSFSADRANLTRPWLPQAQIEWLHVVARVPPGGASAVSAAFNASLANSAAPGIHIVLQPFARGFSTFRQQFSTPLVALMVMAALVLLVACANVANVLLARAVGREREIAVRMAIGAGRARLFHQFLTESALLVIMASATALLIGRWAADLLVRVATATTEGPPPFAATLDPRVLVFAAGVALLSVMIFGVWPAWRATRVDVVSALKSSRRGSTGSVRPARVLVMAQVALSLVLVTGTGLFVRSFQNLLDVGLGFESERLVTVGIEPRLATANLQQIPEMQRRVLEAVSAVPGVESAALAMCGLQGSCSREGEYTVDGYRPRAGESMTFSVNAVTPNYFSTVGMTLLAGRALRDGDRMGQVAVVNKTLASRYFGDWRLAIGHRFGLDSPTVEIVGIVEDARGTASLKSAPLPGIFVPLPQPATAARALEVRTSLDPAIVIAAVRAAIRGAAPDLPIDSVETVAARVRRGLSQERLVVLLTSGFSALAMAFAGFGLFGVLSYAVAQRAPEIGLRLALGATRSRVIGGIVRDACWLVGCGIVMGLPLVLMGGRLMSGLIFGVSASDSVTLVAAVVVLLGVGAACGIVPALRAARVDPMVALRQE